MVIVAHSIGTTETKVLEYNKERTSLAVFNNHGSAVVYFRQDRGVAAANGFPIRGYGSISLNIPEDDPSMELWLISDTASTSVRVYEGFGE